MQTTTEKQLIEKLSKARGKNFVRLFREADATIGERLRQEVNTRRADTGTVSFRFLGQMAKREGLAVKTMFRMLEDGVVLPSGTYEMMILRGIKPCYLLKES